MKDTKGKEESTTVVSKSWERAKCLSVWVDKDVFVDLVRGINQNLTQLARLGFYMCNML